MMARRVSEARRSLRSKWEDDPELTEKQRRRRYILNIIFQSVKIAVFVAIWIFFTVLMIISPDDNVDFTPTAIYTDDDLYVPFDEPSRDEICIHILGNIDADVTHNPSMAFDGQPYITVSVVDSDPDLNDTHWESEEWRVYFAKPSVQKFETVERYFKILSGLSTKSMDILEKSSGSDSVLLVKLSNDGPNTVAIKLGIDANPIDLHTGVIVALVLLIMLYILIVFDITDRTFAAILMALTGVGVLCIMGKRPSVETLIAWIDVDTVTLLFGMMILVGIFAETGIFGYISVVAYRISRGRTWILLFLLCIITVILSAVLDNVTILMLMVPIVIRVSESMGLRTTSVLITVVIFSNVGGALTPVGDPPNVIIVTNPYVARIGVDFCQFILHMFPGVFFGIIGAWFYLYLVLRKQIFNGAEQLRRSISTLNKRVNNLNNPTPSEEIMRRDILKRIEELKEQYRRNPERSTFGPQPAENFIETLAAMQTRYKITDMPLFIKSIIALTFAVFLFSMHSVPAFGGVTLPWTAFLAALLLLILANFPNIGGVLKNIEWATLIFFAALFVFIEVCTELGLIDWVGDRTTEIIMRVDDEHRVITATLLILWISAVFSTFVDHIPVVSMMIKLTIKLALNDQLKIPLLPMLWGLSYGVCFGGNGSLIAASSNVVAAGLANQHGYKITFYEFFKYGFPVMVLTNAIASFYLFLAHGVFKWH